MQKIAEKASILIWSIFLSLALWVTFISVSTQINKNLKENSSIKDNITIENNIEQALKKAIINKDYKNVQLSSKQVLIFEKSNYLRKILKENEEITIKIINPTNITIVLNQWAPVEYNNTTSNIKWIVDLNDTFQSWINELKVRNLWWYSDITITWEQAFESEYKSYKIIEKIWNKNILKEKWQIKVF